MPIGDHLDSFAGLPVRDYSSEEGIVEPGKHAYRLAVNYDAFDKGETFEPPFAEFVTDAACPQVQALLVGDWGGSGEGNDSAPVVEALVSARDRLPALRALFLGEIVMEESEISWINQSDVSPLFEAFPQLEALHVRGGNGLSLGRPRHALLRKLVIETGGLPGAVVREVASADLPQLEHLELWLGEENYGNDVSPDDLRGVLAAGRFSKLKYLGLRDDCRADQTAQLLAEMGIPATVKTLDVSMGTLTDAGAQALLSAAWFKQLEKLDVSLNYLTPKVVKLLQQQKLEVDASEQREPDEWRGELHRYVVVAE